MNVCRICLCSSTEMSVNQLKSDDDTSKTYVDIFNFCLSIEIEAEMDEQAKLCTSCFYKVLSFYEFKCLALKSDAYLKTVLSEYEVKVIPPNVGNVKSEDIDYNDNECLDEVLSSPVKDEVSCSEKPDYLSTEDPLPDCPTDKFVIVVVPAETEDIKLIEPNKKTKVQKKKKSKNKRSTTTRYTRSGICGTRILSKSEKAYESKKAFENPGKKVLNLEKHMTVDQSGEESYACSDCGKTFLSDVARNYHHETIHSGMKDSIIAPNTLYACKICWRRFDAEKKLDSHMLSHTRPFVCELCGKSYGTKNRLKIHNQQHHEKIKRFCCQHCPKKYYVRDALTYHLKTHHITNQPSHVCPECGKGFKLWKSFKEHLNCHRTTKEYECHICVGRAFKTQGCLYAHMLTHQTRRHECQQCGAKFTRKEHLTRHQKAKKHGGVTAKEENDYPKQLDEALSV
ncbi:zinc finger protein 461-like isoform X2 [Plodia interpunctella]|uniref:zinc finger protein 461-like isoform X2 n=1 Tax=Plodia interpunctella TaxID=58824 RepID=UPI002367979D|nr:zinc finger protein 461-like isoform X2 [Plodia interpunctella]